MENNWDYWIGIAAPNLEKNTDNDQHDKQKIYGDTKWTLSTLVAGKNTGWSREGLQRFKELCKLETEIRRLNESVENQYLKMKQIKT